MRVPERECILCLLVETLHAIFIVGLRLFSSLLASRPLTTLTLSDTVSSPYFEELPHRVTYLELIRLPLCQRFSFSATLFWVISRNGSRGELSGKAL